MSVDQIAAEALRLSEKERAGLASRLLRSLPPVAFDDDEGVAEALRRDAELDADPSQAMTLRDLDSHIQQRRKS
jgi:putative addiction module component (TIGR02574 family)